MATDLSTALSLSARGMAAQGARLRVVAENIANRDTTGSAPGADPYRRKTITFESRLDRALGAEAVRVKQIGRAAGDFPERHDPAHPAANAAGYVRTPNVNTLVEMMDLREAQRSWNANMSVLETTRGMLVRAIEMLRT